MKSLLLAFNLKHSSAISLWVLMYPLFVFFVYADDVRGSEINSRLGWFFLLIALSYIVRNKFLFGLVLIPFFIAGIVDLFYTSTFHHLFEASLVRVLTDTDTSETIEFLSVYINWLNLIVITFYIVGFIYLIKSLRLLPPEKLKEKIVLVIGSLMFVVAIQQIMFHERFKDVLPGAFGQITDGLNKYFAVKKEMENRPILLSDFSEDVSLENSEKSQVYLVVIGESAVRGHHSLFGYQRQTNPLLEKIDNELILFDDVISPYAVTYLSLSHVLTQMNLNNQMNFTDSLSLVGLSSKAGFKTWWLSNQPQYEGTTLSLSLVADEVRYVINSGVTDSSLLPEIKKALADEAKHKVIFVHLRGSHMTYEKRYPQSRSHFVDASGIKIYTDKPTQKQIDVVNAYDNSIRYTDEVLRQIIDDLKKEKKISGLVYFSDHGEEVYDHKDFIGHELKRVSPEMFEIPFLVWTNDSYKEAFPSKHQSMVANRSKSILADDFFHFGLCFMGINSSLYNKELSFCDSDFVPKERKLAGYTYQDGELQ